MRNLILALNIVVLLGCASVKPVPQTVTAVHTGAPSWCEQWNTYGDVEGEAPVTSNQRFMFHLGFFLSKSDRFEKAMRQDNPTFDEDTMTKIVTCYQENTPALVDQLDKVCATPSSDQDKQINESLNTYIHWCIEQSTTKA